jgi:plastocyanin
MRTYDYLPNNIPFCSKLFLVIGALLSMTLCSSWLLAGELLLANKIYGDATPSHNLTKDKNNQKSLFADKQTNNTVLIVVNASNPTNKIFYNPSPITIKPGNSIIWINKDPTIHTVTSGNTDSEITSYKFDSGMLTFNSTLTYKFDKAGEYYYHCFVHPFMTGKISVVS